VPFNATEEDQERQANEALAAKLKMEAEVSPKLEALFKRLDLDYKAFYATTGTVIDAHAYDDEMSGILKELYEVGAQSAGDRILTFIEDNPEDDLNNLILLLAAFNLITTAEQIDLLRDQVRLNLRTFIDTAVEASTLAIGDTTNRELQRHVQNAQATQLETETIPSLASTAAIAAAAFAAAIPGRVKTIALSESQQAFEGAAQVEFSLITNAANVIDITGTGRTEARKRWVTRGDERVRTPRRGDDFDHVDADGQERFVDEPYVVSGELLMFPRDMSLGASLGNTINCRCTSILLLDVEIDETQL